MDVCPASTPRRNRPNVTSRRRPNQAFEASYQSVCQVSEGAVIVDLAVNASKLPMNGHARLKPLAMPGQGTAGICSAISFCRSVRMPRRLVASSSTRCASIRLSVFWYQGNTVRSRHCGGLALTLNRTVIWLSISPLTPGPWFSVTPSYSPPPLKYLTLNSLVGTLSRVSANRFPSCSIC